MLKVSARAKKIAKTRANISPQDVEEDSTDDRDDSAYSEVEDSDSEDEPESLHSDTLDDESDADTKRRKRKRGNIPKTKKATTRAQLVSPRKKKKAPQNEEELEIEEGQEIVGVVVQAPKEGWGKYIVLQLRCYRQVVYLSAIIAPAGQISQHTLDFLTKLMDPACNDRQW